MLSTDKFRFAGSIGPCVTGIVFEVTQAMLLTVAGGCAVCGLVDKARKGRHKNTVGCIFSVAVPGIGLAFSTEGTIVTALTIDIVVCHTATDVERTSSVDSAESA